MAKREPMTFDGASTQLEPKVRNLEAVSGTFEILNSEGYEQAGRLLVTVKEAKKEVEATRFEMTRPLDESKSAIMAFFKPFTSRLMGVEDRINSAIGAYKRKGEAERVERQRKLDQEAAKERANLEARAQRAEASGKAEKAEALREQSQSVVTAVAASEPTKLAGIAEREVWQYEITNESLLPREHLMPNEKSIGAVVRALKDKAVIPGVRIFSKKVLAGTGR